jgi:hypothetical protein
MHPVVAVVLTAVVLAAVADAAPSAASPNGECKRSGEVTLAGTAEALVVGKRRAGAYIDLRGCLLKTGRRIALTQTYEYSDVVSFLVPVLAGKFAAFDRIEVAEELVGKFLVVQDLRNPRARYELEIDEQAEVRDIVLKRNGSVAWIQNVPSPATRQVVFCKLRDCLKTPDPMPAVVDSGRGIAPRSLELHRGRVTWLRDGQRQSARL